MIIELRDLLWLLLPLAAVSGWYAARGEQRRRNPPSETQLSTDYFRGINYLLNEQPDKAIEVFTQMVEVNTETVETHLALGSLFRRRGEVERAIRIHQNLIARPTLDRAQRALALCELALDYLRAGLLDRAENLFLELAEIPAHAEQALRALMHIYEQEKDWDKAMAVGRRLAQATGRNLGPVLAQYSCERAEHALHDANPSLARQHLREALAVDPRCVRANILGGRIAANQRQDREAIVFWQKVEQQEADYLDEVIADIAAAYRRLDDEPGLYAYLREVARRRPGMRTLLILAEAIRTRDGLAAAHAFLAERLQSQPSVLGLKQLIDLQVAQESPPQPADLGVIQASLDRLIAQQEGYQCRQCGFRGQVLHWQCPACHEWLALQPASCPAVLPAAGNGGSGTRPGPPSPRKFHA
jgi:lipopolysaccharide biosynthesis regulator YciM